MAPPRRAAASHSHSLGKRLPFEGKRLERIPGLTAYWGIWAQFHPQTEVVEIVERGD